MLSAYQAGYFAGRFVTRVVKFYVAGKFIDSAISNTSEFAKHHRIESKNPEVLTTNVFDCLEFLE